MSQVLGGFSHIAGQGKNAEAGGSKHRQRGGVEDSIEHQTDRHRKEQDQAYRYPAAGASAYGGMDLRWSLCLKGATYLGLSPIRRLMPNALA